MGAKVSWYIQDRVVLNYFWDDISAQELGDTILQSGEFVRAGTYPVHTIIHMLDATGYPMNLGVVLKAATTMKDIKFGWLIPISDDRLVRFFVSTASQVIRGKFRGAPSVQAALEFLADVDPSLPELSPLEDYLIKD